MEMIDKLRELSKKLKDSYFMKEFEEGFEKLLKERDVKIYHTETQQDYDALMSELEEKGCKWLRGEKPTNFHVFKMYGKNTYIYDEYGVIQVSSGEYFKEHYSNEPVIKYKTKGENMTQEEMKQNIIDWATDVSVAIEAAIKDIKFKMKKSTVKADLKEAKSSAKKLIEKIDEYLETLKHKFKVGDYVTVYVNRRTLITKIDKLTENNSEAHGLWYDQTLVNVKEDCWSLSEGNIFRHATPEEIVEYKVALNFHKHGRKPFEVKEGDLIKYPNGQNIMIYHPDCFSKTDFLNDGFKLLKTAEEVSEWLKGEKK